jgi:hypothetical protein
MDEAIYFLEEALILAIQLAEDDTCQVASVFDSLSKMHSLRYQRVGDQGPDIALSIIQIQTSAMLTPPSDPNHVSRLTCVGSLFLARFTQTAIIDDFDAAVEALHHSCGASRLAGIPDQWNFNATIQLLGDVVKQMVEHAIEAAGGDHDNVVIALNKLKGLVRRLEQAERLGHSTASEHLTRHSHAGIVACFGRLEQSLQAAISNTASDNAVYAELVEELGFTLIHRFGVAEELDDIERAPDYYRIALTNTRVEDTNYLRRLLGLTEFLRQRYIVFPRAADLEESIVRGWEAVGSTFSDAIVLVDEMVTVSNVREQLQDSSWVHFACHAEQNAEEPLKSGFRLTGLSIRFTALAEAHFQC